MTEEQQNLSRRERRAQAKGKSSEAGTEDIKDRNQRLRAEAAARRRKARSDERERAAEEGLDAGERVDDALARSADAAGKFIRNNFTWLQWIIVLGVATGIGLMIFNFRKKVGREKQGAVLASVLQDQFGRVATAEPDTPSDSRLEDPRSEFPDQAAKEKAAIEAWKKLDRASTDELELAADLGRAGALYDAGKYAEARKAYEAIIGRPQITLAPALRGRALEGVGFTWEAEEKYEEAKKAFEKLSSIDLKEFKRLHTFHVARVEYLLGNRDKAKEMLEKLDAELSQGAPAQGPTDYLGAATRDLLKTVDPSRAAEEQKAISAEQMQEMLKQFQEMQKGQGGPGQAGPGTPAIPGLPSLPDSPGTIDLEDLVPPGTVPTPPAPESPSPSAPPVKAQPAPAPAPAPAKAPATASPEPAPAPASPAPGAVTPAAPTPSAPAPQPAPAE